MSKKDELQAQRNELFNHSTETLARIKELDKEIAEEAKPELRNLDYGFLGGNGRLYIRTRDHKITVWHDGDKWHSCELDSPAIDDIDLIGNLDDDLQALQENVTEFKHVDADDDSIEFEIEGKHISVISHDELDDISVCVTIKNQDFPGFALNVKKMEATMKRNATS